MNHWGPEGRLAVSLPNYLPPVIHTLVQFVHTVNVTPEILLKTVLLSFRTLNYLLSWVLSF